MDELIEWVQDLGLTQGKMAAYDHIMSNLWVTKGLLAPILMEINAKDNGDMESVYVCKEHNSDYCLMHHKEDVFL